MKNLLKLLTFLTISMLIVPNFVACTGKTKVPCDVCNQTGLLPPQDYPLMINVM